MRNYAFKVIYLNGNEETFYTTSFLSAIYLASAYAVNQGWDLRIKYIANEIGETIKDICPPTFTYSI